MTDTAREELVRELEAALFRAWPAPEERLGGWILRLGAGWSRRANSVNPLGDPPGDALAAARECARRFRARGLRPVLRITPAARPPDLDRRLEAAGWTREGGTLVMVRADGEPPTAPDASVTHAARPDAAWLARHAAWNGLGDAEAAAHATILDAIALPCSFATRAVAGEPVACGLAVADGRRLFLFDLATAPAARRRGHARRLAGALLAWGRSRGAGEACLQVVAENAPARALWASLGFRDLYPYWYRAAPGALPRARMGAR